MTNERTPWNDLPSAPMFKNASNHETDWLDAVLPTRHAAADITAAARAEADVWLGTKSAAVLADAGELTIQADGYANLWAGQYGDRSGIAHQAFMDRIKRVAVGVDAYEDYFEEDRSARVRYEKSTDGEEVDTTKGASLRTAERRYSEDPGPWTAQFAGVGENVWSGNGISFDTYEEAAAYARNKLFSWTGADVARVVPWGTPTHFSEGGSDPVDLTADNIVVNYRTGVMQTAPDGAQIYYGGDELGEYLDSDDPDSMPAQVTDFVPTTQAFNAGEFTVEGAGTYPGFYRTYENLDGDTLMEWVPEGRKSDMQSEKERLFPNGIPLRGELTPEQEAWLKRRSSRTAGYVFPEVNTADEARDAAIDYQIWAGDAVESWGDVADAGAFLESLVDRFPELRDEFIENGLYTEGAKSRAPEMKGDWVKPGSHWDEAEGEDGKDYDKGEQMRDEKGRFASVTSPEEFSSLLVKTFTHPSTGFKVYDVYQAEAGRWAHVYDGPMVDRPRVQIYDAQGGIGSITETIYLDGSQSVQDIVEDRLGIGKDGAWWKDYYSTHQGSRRRADLVADDNQDGSAQSTLPDVDVQSAPENFDQGWLDDEDISWDSEEVAKTFMGSRTAASAYDIMMGQAGPDAGVVSYKARKDQYWTTTHFSGEGDLERLLDGKARSLDMTGMYETPEEDAEYSDVLVFRFPEAGPNSDAYVWQGSLAASPTLMNYSGVTASRRTAADGDTSFCRLCGKELQQQDYAWYALKASPTQRDVGSHYCVPARVDAGRPGEFGPDGELVPGTPGGEGGQYDAPAGTIYDAGGNAIQISSARRITAGSVNITVVDALPYPADGENFKTPCVLVGHKGRIQLIANPGYIEDLPVSTLDEAVGHVVGRVQENAERLGTTDYTLHVYRDARTGSKKVAENGLRPIYEIAADIKKEWGGKVNFGAAPYLDAMMYLSTTNDYFYSDSGQLIVSYFLSNASSFRGDRAKELKAELKAHVSRRGASRTAASDEARAKYDAWSGKDSMSFEDWYKVYDSEYGDKPYSSDRWREASLRITDTFVLPNLGYAWDGEEVRVVNETDDQWGLELADGQWSGNGIWIDKDLLASELGTTSKRKTALPGDDGTMPEGAHPPVPLEGWDDSAMFEPGEIEGDWDEENKATNPNTTTAARGPEFDFFD